MNFYPSIIINCILQAKSESKIYTNYLKYVVFLFLTNSLKEIKILKTSHSDHT